MACDRRHTFEGCIQNQCVKCTWQSKPAYELVTSPACSA